VDSARYLDRIGWGPTAVRPDLEHLKALHTAHLLTVPFENLDVYHGRGVSTSVEQTYRKIVERRRGGWCFELNGAFGRLLRELGYDVDLVSCRVLGDDGWGPPFDHLALVVRLDGERWLADVGFGDSCIAPIRLVDGHIDGAADAVPRPVRCRIEADGFVISERQPELGWIDTLFGTFDARSLNEFEQRSHHLQTAPGSSWSEKPFATRLLDATGSRVTLRRDVLRTRVGTAEFVDQPVTAAEWSAVLADRFGLDDHL
jgi:N-hydroxyarylamine O-acetyltransferase